MKKSLFRSTSLVLGSIFAAITVSAQIATPTPKVDDDVIKVESRLVVVPVAVTTADGQPVAGLTASDFKIAEEGKPQQIENVGSADVVPLEIALLFDISASTDAMFKFEKDTAAKFLRDVMRPNDRATIFTIGAKPTLVQARETSEKSAEAINSIVPTKEFTSFYDTVGLAAEYLRKNAPNGTRRVILVISDGEDTNSTRISKAIQDGFKKVGEKINTIDNKTLYQMTVKARNEASISERQRVVKSLQNADTVYYSINPAGSSFQLNTLSVFGQQNMQLFADSTGGTAFLPQFQPTDTKDAYQNGNNVRKNSEILDGIFRQLANELRAQYLIQFYSDADFPLGRFVKLSVGLTNRTGLKVRARDGYYVKQ